MPKKKERERENQSAKCKNKTKTRDQGCLWWAHQQTVYMEGENQCTCKDMPTEISKAEMKREKCFKWKRLSENLDEITGVAYM